MTNNCGICKSLYKPPVKTMSCGHNFCQTCLVELRLKQTPQQQHINWVQPKKIHDLSTTKSHAAPTPVVSLTCPVCLKATTLPQGQVGLLPTNSTVDEKFNLRIVQQTEENLRNSNDKAAAVAPTKTTDESNVSSDKQTIPAKTNASAADASVAISTKSNVSSSKDQAKSTTSKPAVGKDQSLKIIFDASTASQKSQTSTNANRQQQRSTSTTADASGKSQQQISLAHINDTVAQRRQRCADAAEKRRKAAQQEKMQDKDDKLKKSLHTNLNL